MPVPALSYSQSAQNILSTVFENAATNIIFMTNGINFIFISKEYSILYDKG
jgi:hypothetical protein